MSAQLLVSAGAPPDPLAPHTQRTLAGSVALPGLEKVNSWDHAEVSPSAGCSVGQPAEVTAGGVPKCRATVKFSNPALCASSAREQ